jgi:hypothetical protein
MSSKYFVVGKLYAFKINFYLFKGIKLKSSVKINIPNHRPFLVIQSSQAGIEILLGNEKLWLSNHILDDMSKYDFYEIQEI